MSEDIKVNKRGIIINRIINHYETEFYVFDDSSITLIKKECWFRWRNFITAVKYLNVNEMRIKDMPTQQ